jgi:hypothetical protein
MVRCIPSFEGGNADSEITAVIDLLWAKDWGLKIDKELACKYAVNEKHCSNQQKFYEYLFSKFKKYVISLFHLSHSNARKQINCCER